MRDLTSFLRNPFDDPRISTIRLIAFTTDHDKPVALIRASGTGQIFDVDNLLRVYDYNPNLWKSTLANDLVHLTKHFKAAWDNRESPRTYMKILTGKQ